jgi:hypothetical protein
MSKPGDLHVLEKNGDDIEVRHGEYPGEHSGVRVFVWRTDKSTLRVTLMGISDSRQFDVTANSIEELPE